ncbi:MAG: ankyrin repeat domain-containing protein [Erythrobacter cryptus]
MSLRLLRKLTARGPIAAALALLIAGLAAAPAAAQFQSEGYQFLKAVEERDGDKATEMLNKPGNQLVNTRDVTSGDTGLHIVVARSDTLWLRFLLENGADPNIRNRKGITPLQLAVALGFVDGAEILIKRGANVNISDQTGETPLIAAVHQRNPELVRVLLAQGADPDHNDNSGRSARQYMELMSGNSLMKQIFQEADDKRAGKEPKRQYGPSF